MAAENRDEQGFGELIDDLDAIVWQADARSLRFSYVNARAVELFGYDRNEWYEPDFWRERLIHPDDRAVALARCMEAVAEGRDHRIEYRAVSADGDVIWIRDRIRVVKSHGGKAELLRGVMLDITGERLAEQQLERKGEALQALADEQAATLGALRASEERFRLLSEHIPQVFWIARPDGSPTFVSPGYDEVWGRPMDPEGHWTELIHPDDRERMRIAFTEPPTTPTEYTYRIVRPDGAERWIRSRAYPTRNRDGVVERIVGIAEDVTDWKLANDRLLAAEAHYRRLVRTSPYAVYVLDREGRITELNPAAEEIVQNSSDQLLGRTFEDLIPAGAAPPVRQAFEMVLQGETDDIEMDVPILRPSGEVRWLTISATAIEGDGEEVVGVHGIARDVTAEREADHQRRLLAAALDNLPDAVSITGPDGRFLYLNPAHATLLGYDPGSPPADLDSLDPDEEEIAARVPIAAALLENGRWSGRVRRRRADGSHALIQVTATAVSDGDSRWIFTVLHDASDEIAREGHLRRVERLASLGTLIGGVAHELNNPLTAVVGFAHLMLMDERSPEDQETLSMMAREAERAARIVADLRVVARDTQQDRTAEFTAVDLNEVARHVLRVRRYALDTNNIVVDEQFADELPAVRGSRAQLEQVVVNLVVNAEQALAGLDTRARRLTIGTRTSPAGVVLYVRDNGPGISGEHVDRVFDPFFTTKPPGEGTGLGLSLVHSIVSEHGGGLQVEGGPGAGAEFIVELPAMQSAADDAAADADAIEHTSKGLRVLVVDDESAIRDLLARTLRRRGHAVTEASEGGEALRLIEDPATGFDVVVSDLRMPGLGGAQLLERLRAARPGLAERVIFITGDPAATGADQDMGVPVLMKPFRLDDVIELIEGVHADRS